MHTKGCPKSGRMKMTIDTTSYPANPHKVLVRVIFDALRRGRRRNGMSKKSIQSRIEQTYRCKLGVRFEKELTKSLKRLVRSRNLERFGYRYKAAGEAPSSRGRRLNEALPVTCRCSSKTHSRSSSICPTSQRSCKPYSGISGVTTATSQRCCGCRSRSRSRSRSTARCTSSGRRKRVGRRRRSRRGRTLRMRKRGKRGKRKRRPRRGRTRSRSRHSSTNRRRGRSLSRSRMRSSSRTTSVRRVSVSSRRSRSRSRGRSRTRRTRNMFSSRSQTRSTSRKRRRIRYTWKIRTRSTSRSSNGGGVASPRQHVVVPVPKLDARRGLFEPGLVPAISTAASTSHAVRRASPYPHHSPAPSAVMTRGPAHSPGRGRHNHRSSSVPARSRSRNSSQPPSSPSAFPYLPFLKPTKPALRQSAPQSPDAPDTLTPKSMVKFLTK